MGTSVSPALTSESSRPPSGERYDSNANPPRRVAHSLPNYLPRSVTVYPYIQIASSPPGVATRSRGMRIK